MSKANDIYNKAVKNGLTFDCNCTSISSFEWDKLMKGATKANKKKIQKILADNNLWNKKDFKYRNPYQSYKTKTHLIYVHSSIEYFFKINS